MGHLYKKYLIKYDKKLRDFLQVKSIEASNCLKSGLEILSQPKIVNLC